MKCELWELQQLQGLPLSLKVQKTKLRLKEWVDKFGVDGVYVSFSGGKDSTVLLNIARQLYPDIKGVFVDTGLEFPEIRDFVAKFDNIEWIKPKMNFKKVIETYGYPIISKEVSECVQGARRYVKELDRANGQNTIARQTDRQTELDYAYRMADLLGIDRRINKENSEFQAIKMGNIPKQPKFQYKYDRITGWDNDFRNKNLLPTASFKMINGKYPNRENGVETKENSSMFDRSRYKFFLDAPFEISNKCCNVMKKSPVHDYGKNTDSKPITAQMASESRLRMTQWLKNGCNGFDLKSPISNPMSFWTENDVLQYILENELPICPLYGDIVENFKKEGICENQQSLSDYGLYEPMKIYKTTDLSRTGCVFCLFGAHLEKEYERSRLVILSRKQPAMYDYCMRGGAFDEDGLWKPTNNGLGMWFPIKWIEVHGNVKINTVNLDDYIEKYGNELTREYLK